MFSQCGDSYIRRVKHLFPVSHIANITTLEASPIQETQTAGIPEDLTMHLSQFYLALIGRDESGTSLSHVFIFYKNRLNMFW